MKRSALLPTIVVALVACTDAATAPKTLEPGRPALDVSPGTYAATINDAFAPSGAHLQTGSIGCTVNADRSIDCDSFQLSGVGNTNVTVLLFALYTAIIDCNNHGSNKNNPVESHTQGFAATSTATVNSTKNGRLNIPSRSVDPFGVQQVCPNPNWTPEIRDGTVTLLGFRYAIVFFGFSDDANEDFILIASGDDPRP